MEKTKPFSGDISLIVLIIANLLPILGVLAWDWSVFEIVVLYWFENVVIGAFNILKMMTFRPDSQAVGKKNFPESEEMPDHLRNSGGMHQGGKFFLIPFFTVHYGMFCFVHGVFVFALLGGKSGRPMGQGDPFQGMARMIGELTGSGAVLFVLAIVASHLFSFITNYIGKGEFRRVTGPQLMAAPYGRIVVLHIAILFGAFAVMLLGQSVFLLLILIIGKIVIDAKLHLRSHSKVADSSFASWSRKG